MTCFPPRLATVSYRTVVAQAISPALPESSAFAASSTKITVIGHASALAAPIGRISVPA